MSYAKKYNFYFKDTYNRSWEVRFLKKNYSGSSTEITGTAEPVVDNFKGKDDEIETPIRVKTWRITIFDQGNGTYDEFFTSDSRMFRVDIYKDSVLNGMGWIDVDTYSRPLFTTREDITIYVNDGLAGLKNIEWIKPDNTNFSGYVTLKDAICACLYRTDLELGLFESCDIYAQGMSYGDNDSMFIQAKFNSLLFRDENCDYDNCYNVLETILKRFQCEIYQMNGAWNLTRINNRSAEYTRRYYDYDSGNYDWTVTGTYNPVKEIDGTTSWFWDMPVLTPRPAWKKFIIEQDYGLNTNIASVKICDLKVFQKPYELTVITDPLNKFGAYNNLNYVINSDNSIRLFRSYTPDNDGYLQVLTILEDDNDYRLKISLAMNGNAPIKVIAMFYKSGGGIYYLDSFGYWHLNGTDKRLFYSNANTFEPIYTNELPGDGIFVLRIFQPLATTSNRYVDVTIKPEDIKIEVESIDGFKETEINTTTINLNNFYQPDTLELKLGDVPDIPNADKVYLGGLYLDDGVTHTANWFEKAKPTILKTLNGLIADEISSNHVYSNYIITGVVHGEFEMGDILEVDNKLFLITRASYNRYECDCDLDMVQIAVTEEGAKFLKLKDGGYIRLKGGGKIKLK